MADTLNDLPRPASLVLYCVIRRRPSPGEPVRFALIRKNGHPTFPPTKFRPAEDLYHALIRPMERDLGVPLESYFAEQELPAIPNSGQSPRYPGMARQWQLYPVVMSLTTAATQCLTANGDVLFWTIEEILAQAQEPNVLEIAKALREQHLDQPANVPTAPSMDAVACHWSAAHEGGVRVVRQQDIHRILSAGSRAFNLRVADPYLPYQKQGLGFTWSFFTPKDKQDVHVHGMPAVEIYGVIEGRLQIWHKPMNQRGVRTWSCQTLLPGDWAEVEPLQCHFACWLSPEGLGTVIKAAATGELAGVGRLGVSGKTTCQWKTPAGRDDHCSAFGQCHFPPAMQTLISQYSQVYDARDYAIIEAIGREAKRADVE